MDTSTASPTDHTAVARTDAGGHYLVPAFVADVATQLGVLTPQQADTLAGHGRRVDVQLTGTLQNLADAAAQRGEIDLTSAADDTPDAARQLGRWWLATLAFWQQLCDSSAQGQPFVAARRRLLVAQQRSSGTDRRDLVEHAATLRGMAGIGPVFDELLSAEPDQARIVEIGRPWAVTVTPLGDQALSVLAHLPTRGPEWPLELGAAATPGEVRRVVTVTASHATWRKRAARRLVSVVVDVDEMWPHPTSVTTPQTTAAGAASGLFYEELDAELDRLLDATAPADTSAATVQRPDASAV